MSVKELTGTVPADAVAVDIPRLPTPLLERLRVIDDLSGTISDVLDELGHLGALGLPPLQATIPGARVVGTALTIRDLPAPRQPYHYTEQRTSLLGEIEAHNQAQPGDVLVIQGVPGVSSLGGLSAAVGKRQGELGAIVDGSVRDVGWQRSIDYPAWCRSTTPVTGKWRLQTVEINRPVTISGIRVCAGDLAVADETGVCFVPAGLVERVVERAEEIAAGEAVRHADISAGLPVPALATKKYAYKQTSVRGS